MQLYSVGFKRSSIGILSQVMGFLPKIRYLHNKFTVMKNEFCIINQYIGCHGASIYAYGATFFFIQDRSSNENWIQIYSIQKLFKANKQ